MTNSRAGNEWAQSSSARYGQRRGSRRRRRKSAQGPYRRRAVRSSDLAFTRVAGLRSYWRWLGQRLRLSQPGRVIFTVSLLAGVAAMVVARAHGDREGGAPLVVLALVVAGVVALDAVGRGVVAVV